MTTYRCGILAFTLSLLTAASISHGKHDTPPVTNGVWAWDDTSEDTHAVFISRQAGSEWMEPERVSDNEGVNVVPTVIKTTEKNLFVIWSSFIGQQAQLRYRQYKKGVWAEESEYYTGLTSNTSPSAAMDKDGKVWLVWAGYNGISDDIYYTTWNGDSFDTARPLTANDVPDIQPILGIDEETGHPRLQWQQFAENGYITVEASWNGSTWSKPVELPAPAAATETTAPVEPALSATPRSLSLKKAGFTAATTRDSRTADHAGQAEKDFEIDIPPFINHPESASIHIPGHAIQSLPVRSIIENQ